MPISPRSNTMRPGRAKSPVLPCPVSPAIIAAAAGIMAIVIEDRAAEAVEAGIRDRTPGFRRYCTGIMGNMRKAGEAGSSAFSFPRPRASGFYLLAVTLEGAEPQDG
jgi:hypothetical protein